MQENNYPIDWSRLKIKELTQKFLNGGTPSTHVKEHWDGNIPWITGADAEQRLTTTSRKTITELGVRRSSTNIVPKGNILLVTRTGVGKVSMSGVDVAISQDLTGLIPRTDLVDVPYLYYQLTRVMSDLKSLAQGSIIQGIKRDEVEKIEIPLPELAEQRAIADILSTLDEGIAQSESLVRKYQSIKQGLMFDLLIRGVDENGELRPTYEDAPKLYKQTEFGFIPSEWGAGTLASFCELHNHLRMPIAGLDREHMQGEYPYYGPTGIIDYINEYRVEGEFVLIGEDGDHFLKFADWAMTHWVNGQFNVNNHAHIMKGRNGCSTQWLHRFFSHRDITLSLTRQGAGRFKLNKASLLKLGIAVPKLEEQQKISEIISAMERSIQTSLEQLVKLNGLKQGLMQDLLSGQVRVMV